MQLEQLLDRIKEGIGHNKQRGHETVFKDCPFCGNDRWNFELNMPKQKWHCWVCGKGGLLQSLLNFLDIQYDGILPTPPKEKKEASQGTGEVFFPKGMVVQIEQCKIKDKVLAYLRSRGITEEDIQTYEIMWWEDQVAANGAVESVQRLIFPFRNGVGNLVFWTARTIYKNIRPKYYHAAVPKLDRIIKYDGQGDDTAIYMVEGVFDALRLNKMGKTVIILMGTDIPDVVIEYIRAEKKQAVLVLDNDAARKQMEHETTLAKAIGRENVRAVYLQEKDVADIGLKGVEGFGGFVRSRIR